MHQDYVPSKEGVRRLSLEIVQSVEDDVASINAEIEALCVRRDDIAKEATMNKHLCAPIRRMLEEMFGIMIEEVQRRNSGQGCRTLEIIEVGGDEFSDKESFQEIRISISEY